MATLFLTAQNARDLAGTTNGGPGGSRTHGVLSEADYESAACNQHGVRPKKKTRSEGRARTLMWPTYYTKKGASGIACLRQNNPEAPSSTAACLNDNRRRSIPFEERLQLVRTARVTQLAQRLCLDLTDPFTRHVELLADFFERVIGAHLDTETHAQHLRFTRREGIEHVLHD